MTDLGEPGNKPPPQQPKETKMAETEQNMHAGFAAWESVRDMCGGPDTFSLTLPGEHGIAIKYEPTLEKTPAQLKAVGKLVKPLMQNLISTQMSKQEQVVLEGMCKGLVHGMPEGASKETILENNANVLAALRASMQFAEYTARTIQSAKPFPDTGLPKVTITQLGRMFGQMRNGSHTLNETGALIRQKMAQPPPSLSSSPTQI